jgi:oligo-alginate lyase
MSQGDATVMKSGTTTKALIFVALGLFSASAWAQGQAHPLLILARDDVAQLVEQKDKLPLLRETYQDVRAAMDAALQQPIEVPVPRDGGGGITHEQHKSNYLAIHDAGILYQLTGDRRYAAHARDLLLAYAELYPTLSAHPARRNDQYYGKLFWQILNDTVWLVYSIQGYDAIIDSLSADERKRIEQGVFRPMVKFLTEESPLTIQRIHNHGTWALAAVGMTGYVLGDKDLVEKALYGLDKSGNTGFMKQLDRLFSPDGYYEEGPYYQRYSLMPFLLFSRAVQRNEPERKIFEYRDGILLKAINTAIHLSYNNKLFPINNSIKSKGLDTVELMHGVAIAYAQTGDPAL